MEGALAGVTGVQSAKCNYQDKTATVVLEEGEDVDGEALVAALTEAGFGASIVK